MAPEILKDPSQRIYSRSADIWALGVILYICLCGFPPFSEDLNLPDQPYTLSQQIQGGRYVYPAPYWDHVHDEALDLIDEMLTVDQAQRANVGQCLRHQWMQASLISHLPATDEGAVYCASATQSNGVLQSTARPSAVPKPTF